MQKFKKIIYMIFFINLFILSSGFGLPSINSILKEIDDRGILNSDMTVKVKITQEKKGQGVKIIEAIYYRRDKDDAFLIFMTAPNSEKGNGYLRIDNNMWMYRRNTRTFQHINRDEKISGSNASTGDLELKKYIQLYKGATDENGKEIITEENLGKADLRVYCIEVLAKEDNVKYPKLKIWVDKEKYIIYKVDSYSLSGTLMETSYYKNYSNINGKYIPLWMMFVDKFEEGNMSLIEISGVSLNKINDSVFTKAYLENISK